MSLDVAQLAPQLIGIASDWYHGHSSAKALGEFPSLCILLEKPENRALSPVIFNQN